MTVPMISSLAIALILSLYWLCVSLTDTVVVVDVAVRVRRVADCLLHSPTEGLQGVALLSRAQY